MGHSDREGPLRQDSSEPRELGFLINDSRAGPVGVFGDLLAAVSVVVGTDQLSGTFGSDQFGMTSTVANPDVTRPGLRSRYLLVTLLLEFLLHGLHIDVVPFH